MKYDTCFGTIPTLLHFSLHIVYEGEGEEVEKPRVNFRNSVAVLRATSIPHMVVTIGHQFCMV